MDNQAYIYFTDYMSLVISKLIYSQITSDFMPLNRTFDPEGFPIFTNENV